MSFLFGKKEDGGKAEAANRKEFDQLVETIRLVYDQAQTAPQAALNEVKHLLCQVKAARTLDKRQRSILNAFAHDTAGFIYLELHRPEEALSEMEKALGTYQSLPDKTPLVNNYLNQSRAWMMRNDVPHTFTSLERGLALAKEGGLTRAEADVLYKLGVLYSLTEQLEKAQEIFRRGLLLAQQLGDRVTLATFLAQLGQLNLQLDNFGKAEDYLLSSMAVFEEYKDSSNLLQTYDQLVQLYRRKDEYPKSLEFAQKGLELARSRADAQEESNFLQDMAMLNYLENNYEMALGYGQESLKLAECSDDSDSKIRACSLLAQVTLYREDYNLAQHYAEMGYALSKGEKYRREQAVFLNNFAEVKLAEGNIQVALKYLEQVGVIFKEIGDLPTLAALYVRMGDLYLEGLDDAQSTAQMAEKAFNLCREQSGEVGMFAFTSALHLLQLLAERGHYEEGLTSAGHCLNAANQELQIRSKEGKNSYPAAQQAFWLLFVQVLMIIVATLQDLKNNKPACRSKVDDTLFQLKDRFGDSFTLDAWTEAMYARIA